MAELTPKQQRFVEEYAIDLNGTQAAIRAGYSPKSANEQAAENLAKPSIAAAVKAVLDKRSKRVELSQDWVIRKLKQNLRRALQVEAVKDYEGNATGEYRYEGSVANKALELLGKHLGMFGDKLQVKHEFADLDDAALVARAELVIAKRKAGA